MKRFVFVIVVLAVVASVLAGGVAYILMQNKNNEYRRAAAQAEEKMENKEYVEAISLLRKAEEKGGNARTTFLLGKANYERENYEEAVKYFDIIEAKYARTDYMPQALLYKAQYQQDVLNKPNDAKGVLMQILEKFPDSEIKDFALYRLAKIIYNEGDIAQTKKFLDSIIKNEESPAREDAEFILGEINIKQLKSPDIGPNDIPYVIKRGDSLWKLERTLKVPMDLIKGINNLDERSLTVGQQIKIPDLDLSIVVDKGKRTLTLRNKGAFLSKYKVGINSIDARIPAKDYEIIEKHPKGMEYAADNAATTIKAGEPGNPYGSRWLSITRETGIHGTNEPEKIGKYIDNGFIAMANEDIEELYSLVRKGTKVHVKGRNNQETGSGK